MTPDDVAADRLRELLAASEIDSEIHRLRALYPGAWRAVVRGPLNAHQWMQARAVTLAAEAAR